MKCLLLKNKLKMLAICFLCLFKPLLVVAASMDVSEIEPLITDYMKKYKVPGVEVIIQRNGKSHLYSFGYMNANKKAPITSQTIFELGSITKTFIGLLLSEQALKNDIKSNDPLLKYFGKNDSGSIKNLTPLGLATHTSGLPFTVSGLPYNAPLLPKYQTAYTHFLRTWQSPYVLGTRFRYSNIGFSLLADALATNAHVPLSSLMQTDIFQPLGMSSSMLSITKNWNELYAQGYTSNDIPARTADQGLLGGAWAIKSSGQDMSYYLNAVMGNADVSPLMLSAIKMAQTGYFQRVNDNSKLGLGWMITPLNKNTIYKKLVQAPVHYNLEISTAVHKIENPTYDGNALIDKIGATDGFRAYIGFIPNIKLGIIILTNKYTQNTGELQNIGRKILLRSLGKDMK